VNMDGIINILDVVVMLNMILGIEDENDLADMNGDGTINIQDIVLVINLILGPRVDNASQVQLFNTGTEMKMKADGYVGAVKIVLQHEGIFNIDLTEQALAKGYNTKRNITTLVIVSPESEHLFSYEGTFSIVEIEAANSLDFIPVLIPSQASLGTAYPNPFNPATNIGYMLASQGEVNLSIYNISGQLIQTLVNGYQDVGSYSLVWDASSQPSGMYFLRLHTTDEVHSKKLMLIK